MGRQAAAPAFVAAPLAGDSAGESVGEKRPTTEGCLSAGFTSVAGMAHLHARGREGSAVLIWLLAVIQKPPGASLA